MKQQILMAINTASAMRIVERISAVSDKQPDISARPRESQDQHFKIHLVRDVPKMNL